MATGRATGSFSAAAGALLALFSLCALAGPEEDYRAAMTAYRGGDMTGAMTTLRRTSDQGHVPSMLLLGYILEQASLDSDAVQVYRKAAEAGSAEGELGLAAMVAAGKGTPRDLPQAVRLYESAAAKGNATATNALAQAYITGTLGLGANQRDNARALAALRRAAEHGYAPAAAELARAYTTGDYGVTPDPVEAARWQPKASATSKAGPAKGGR